MVIHLEERPDKMHSRGARPGVVLIGLALWLGATGCGTATQSGEPDFITVQHILIGYKGSVRGKSITRTAGEAKQLATELLERAQQGEDFDGLVREYTNDSSPGIYKMANFGIPADSDQRIQARDGMVPAFGDVGFPLAVGEIGMAEYHHQRSPFGWHIIKRIE
jgi:hypothetical protein